MSSNPKIGPYAISGGRFSLEDPQWTPIYRQMISKEEITQISSLDYKASPAQVSALIGELLMLRKAVGL